jgi:outer membrane protein assembly factor BamD (BamD/ComL family)
MPRRDRAGLLAGIGVAVILGANGCALSHGAAYDAAVESAARNEGAGRFAAAAADYDKAAAAALTYDKAVSGSTRERDHDEALWDAAAATARAGDVAGATSRFEALAGDGASEHQAEAALRLAILRIDSGDADRGWQDMEQIPRRFPTHGVAHVAVRKLVQHADEQGPRAGLDEVHALERDLEATELVQLLAYLDAVHVETLGDDHAARDAYGRIADRWPYPFGSFFDDALWHASLIDEKFGLYQAAIDDLERLLRQRETTSIVGSYERPKFVPAMLRVGELYRDRLHDRAKAREAFHRFYVDFAHSALRDRALWLEASLWREDGDADTACGRLATLVGQFPDSRYVPCAIAQCPGLARPRASVAPRDCHEYIERTAGRESTGKGD